MVTRDKILKSGVQLLKAFDQPQGIIRDSLVKDIAIINNDPTLDPIQNNLATSGNLMLISKSPAVKLDVGCSFRAGNRIGMV